MVPKFLKNITQELVTKTRSVAAWVGRVSKKHIPLSADDLSFIGAYSAAMGLISWAIFRYMTFVATDLLPSWNVGAGPQTSVFNTSLVTYTIAVLSVISLTALMWLCESLPVLRRLLVRLANGCSVLLLLCSLCAFFITSVLLARIYFAITFLIFVPHLMSFMRNRRVVMMKNHSISFIKYIMPIIILVPLTLAFVIGVKAWYPVHIPNDYIEVPDNVMVKRTDAQHAPLIASRSDVTACMEVLARQNAKAHKEDGAQERDTKNLKKADAAPPKCTLDLSAEELEKLKEPIVKTGTWQAQAGRLLYHHSYVFVPAMHALAYGVLSPIPYLYGIGNTLFHAALLRATSTTLTSYFDTYPIAQGVGILCIVLLIIYITRNVYAAAAACGAVLIALFQLGFDFVLLPPGFSPLRYAGLAVQVASIFCLFRGTAPLRVFSVILALVFSFFWNAEFALIGLIGQALAFISPQWRIAALPRIALLIATAAVAAGCIWVNNLLSTGYLQGMSLGLFGLFPMMVLKNFIVLCALVAISVVVLLYATKQFKTNEQAARLCVLPILVLLVIKFLFYALSVHMYYSLLFMAPVILTYYDWSRRSQRADSFNKKWMEASFAASVVLLAFISSIGYYASSTSFRNTMTNPFESYQWSQIGEQFKSNTPPQPIVSRVEAIRAQIQKDDTVLLLTPFDHLLSFYVNPKHYCGHFEIVLNPITSTMVQSLVDCARTEPNVLIVVDEAETAPCPDGWRANYYDLNSCEYKKNLKKNSVTILRELNKDIVQVKKTGPLTFYRRAH